MICLTSISNSDQTKRSSIVVKGRGKQTIKKKQKLKSIAEYKLQVAEYFCSQLYLMADLCLDRNYLSMRYVEQKYSYELLVAILKNPSSPPKIKAPVCKLARCLYIDRDPQVEIKYPRLIRTLLSESNPMPSANKVHFYLLQEIISDYINKEFDINQCDELSSEILDLLFALMKFGYFSTESQLQDVVAPLCHHLHKHRLETPVLPPQDANNDSSLDLESIPERTHPVWNFQLFFSLNPPSRTHSIQPHPSELETRIPESVSEEQHIQPSTYTTTQKEETSLGFLPPLFYQQQKTVCQTFLQRVESTSYIFIVLILVLLSTGIAILNVVSRHSRNHEFSVLFAVDLAISILFILELLARMYSNFVVHGEILSFLTNRYKLLDLVVVSVLLFLFSGLEGCPRYIYALLRSCFCISKRS